MAYCRASNKFRKYFWWTGISFFNLLLLFYFNNCSEVSFQEAQKGTFELILGEGDDSENIEVVQNFCRDLQMNSSVQRIRFDDPRDEFNDNGFTCEFGKNGNLPERNDYFQARLEQSRRIDIPSGAIICDVQFDFDRNQLMNFDDHFLFLLNNEVLATSLDTLIPKLRDTKGIPSYSWEKIAGTHWGVDNGDERAYCLGASQQLGQCIWPRTEKTGDIYMNFDPLLIKTLVAKNLSSPTQEFKFVMLGDNDEGDCQHSELNFSVVVNYVVPDSGQSRNNFDP